MKDQPLNENKDDADGSEDQDEVAPKVHKCTPCCELDAALNVGEVEPDFNAAKVGAFRTDRRGDAGAKMAGRADVT